MNKAFEEGVHSFTKNKVRLINPYTVNSADYNGPKKYDPSISMAHRQEKPLHSSSTNQKQFSKNEPL